MASLVQRGKFRSFDDRKIKGLDALIEYDYMGASEFEWGALPRSLDRILAHLGEYSTANLNIGCPDGRYLFLTCRQGHWENVARDVQRLASKKVYLQEATYLPEALASERGGDYNFWWCIDDPAKGWEPDHACGDWMLALVKPHQAKLIMKALNAVAESKKRKSEVK